MTELGKRRLQARAASKARPTATVTVAPNVPAGLLLGWRRSKGAVGRGVESDQSAGEGKDLGVGELLVELLQIEQRRVLAATGLQQVRGQWDEADGAEAAGVERRAFAEVERGGLDGGDRPNRAQSRPYTPPSVTTSP